MKNKKILLVSLLLILLVIAAFIIKNTFTNGYKISILNNTSETVTNLTIKYKQGSIIETISTLKPSTSFKYTIDTSSLQGENAIILTYKDNNDVYHTEYLVGYLEKGYSGKVNVTINKLTSDEKLEMNIEEN